MPGVRLQEEKKKMVLVVEARDSAGRTENQVTSMDNAPYDDPPGNAHCQFPPKLRKEDVTWANEVGTENSEYPRVLYHRAISYPKGKDGKPDFKAEPKFIGDIVSPNFPLIELHAELMGAKGNWVKTGADRHLIARHPYKTRLVPSSWTPDNIVIDVDAAKAEEAKLINAGWKRTIQELDLPTTMAAEEISD